MLAAEYNPSIDEHGVAWPGVAETFANAALQPEIYGRLLTLVRDLCGGGLIQLPSSAADFHNEEIVEDLERFIQSPGTGSRDRVKLLKLAWDLVGSEFAGRQHQYEMFYAGAPFVVKSRMYRNYDFSTADRLVDEVLSGYGADLDDEAEDLSLTR